MGRPKNDQEHSFGIKGPRQTQENVYSSSQLPHSERVYQHTRSDGEFHVVT